MKQSLAVNEIHIWQCFVEHWADKDRSGLLAALSVAERKRCAAFHFEKDRTLFALSHALARAALSLYVGTLPEDLIFQCNAYGKPALVGAQTNSIHFNITHTSGYVACAVACGEVGIDAENIERGCDLEVAKQVFTKPELQYLQAQSGERICSCFFELWTLKEAYIKAKGVGMSMDLQSFWFDLRSAPLSISFAAHVPERPEEWEFHAFQPAPQLRMAVACHAAERDGHSGLPAARKSVQVFNGTELLGGK